MGHYRINTLNWKVYDFISDERNSVVTERMEEGDHTSAEAQSDIKFVSFAMHSIALFKGISLGI